MLIDRYKRKKIYKHYVSLGYSMLDWPTWNSNFKNTSPAWQESCWEEREKAMSFTGFKSPIISLGCCEAKAATPVCPYGNEDCMECGTGIYKKKKQQETDMRVNYNVPTAYAAATVAPTQTEESVRRTYLTDRLSNITWQKRDEERKHFGLVDDEAPNTIKERNERFAAGKYVIDWRANDDDYDEDEEFNGEYRAGGSIRWRDPSVKEDKKGYEAAMEKLEADKQKTHDIIVVKGADAGLEALEKFEGTTYH